MPTTNSVPWCHRGAKWISSIHSMDQFLVGATSQVEKGSGVLWGGGLDKPTCDESPLFLIAGLGPFSSIRCSAIPLGRAGVGTKLIICA